MAEFHLYKIVIIYGEIKCKNNTLYIAGIISNVTNGELNKCSNSGFLDASGNTIISGSLVGDCRNQIINNSKWLSNTAEKGIGVEVNVTKNNVEKINNIESMPSVLSVINTGNVFKEDIGNINNGYPILNWQ